MKDSKSILLLVVSVLLILVSCALLWTWGFNFNDFAKEKDAPVTIARDTSSATNATRDSLKNIYAATIQNLGTLDSTWKNADSAKAELDLRLTEFFKLRNEIAVILKNPAKKEDLELARVKIGDLQKKIEQLRSRNTDVERENQRLYAVLQQLRNVQPEEGTTQSAKPVVFENSSPAEKNGPAAALMASEMRLTAMMVEGDKEQETYQATQADKFVGSFAVKNSATPLKNTEVVVVILQPDNKVLQTSAWETGRFETREGKRIYSCKVKFEYSKGENKRLSFSLNADKFLKGTYTMQLYFNGNLIGKTSKTLI